MKSRKVLTILLSLAIMFTFMPAMAFAVDYEPTAPKYTSAGLTKAVSCGEDFHSAKATVKTVDEEGDEATDTYSFGYLWTDGDYEAGNNFAVATAADYKAWLKDNSYTKFFVVPEEGDDYATNYHLAYAGLTKTDEDSDMYADGITYIWEEVGTFAEYFGDAWIENEDEGAVPTWIASMEKTAYDASQMTYYDGGVVLNATTVDAGEYSAFLAGATGYTNPAAVESVGAWDADDETKGEFFTATYPAYDAYEYDTNAAGQKVDKELEVTIALNSNKIKAYYGDVNVSTATGSVTIVPHVDKADTDYYVAYDQENENGYGWYVDMEKTQLFDDGIGTHYHYYYDGKEHDVVFRQFPKNVTAKYYVSKSEISTSAIKDSEWLSEFPKLKDAGTYYIYIQFTTEKNNKTNVEAGEFTIEKRPVFVDNTQDTLVVEYGKYNAETLEAAIAALFTHTDTPDATDSIAEVFDKYFLFKGLFTEAGSSTIYGYVDTDALAANTTLAAAVSNYDFSAAKDSMELVITKADNDVNLKAVTKSYKAKKKTKKLAAKKTFTLSATADYGTVLFKKVSGNAKIKVSASGKVTVKKGLKKGTYKVKVKAYTKGTANYAAGSDTQTIVVKVK